LNIFTLFIATKAVGRRGVTGEGNLKRKRSAHTPSSDHDPGYDTMLAGTNFDDWVGTSSGPEDDAPLVKKVVTLKTVPSPKPVEPYVEYTTGSYIYIYA